MSIHYAIIVHNVGSLVERLIYIQLPLICIGQQFIFDFEDGICDIFQTLTGGYAFTSGIFYEVFTQTFEDANPILVSCLSSLPICTWFAGCKFLYFLTLGGVVSTD